VVVTTDIDMSSIVRTTFETVFGYEGFLGELVYQRRSGGGNDSKHMSVDHETLLIFAKSQEKVSRFMILKTEDELAKYTEEDEESKFHWDTYIRKQAKNYYPIQCPDGTILEHDKDGNRISWYYSESTFKSKLEAGEVKIEQKGDLWKLYMKVRMKETKILRSIVLQNDNLNEIFEDYPEDARGKELLTKEGSTELKQYADDIKPKYAKSAKYYKIIFNVFARNAKRILVPFPEHFCAAIGLHASSSKADLCTSIDNNYKALFDKRALEEVLIKTYVSYDGPVSSLNVVGDWSELESLEFFSSLISARFFLDSDFFEFKSGEGLELRYCLSGSSLFMVSLSEDKGLGDLVTDCVNQILKEKELTTCELFLQADELNLDIGSLKISVSQHELPGIFLA